MIEKRNFTAGMNQDLAESLLQQGMYRYALNIRNGNSERGAVGTITNEEGNREISVTLPSGGNKVIGAIDDEANDRVIYIVYNNNGNNRILAYNYKSAIVNTIVSDSSNTLNLHPDYLITGINVVTGNGTSYLLFTDNYGEPKNIDIFSGIRTYDTNVDGNGDYTERKYLGNFDSVSPSLVRDGEVYYRSITIGSSTMDIFYRAVNTTATDPTSSTSNYQPTSDWEICPAGYIYGTHNLESFTAIVKPHLNKPTAEYTSNGGKYNYLYGSLYQFKVKYVRADGRESAWSPITSFTDSDFPADSYLDPQVYTNIAKLNNQITLGIDVPDTAIYKTIKVAVRRNMNDKSPDDWYLAGKIDVATSLEDRYYSGGVKVKFNFDGSNALMPLDSNDAQQLMSWIPPKALAQSITSRNRVLYANFTEGLPISLDGVDDINQNPPAVSFYERANPYYISSSKLDVYEYNGSTVGSLIPEAYDFAGAVYDSGIAFEFPSTVTVGVSYSINLTVEYLTNGTVNDFSQVVGGSTIKFTPSSTSTATLLDQFVNEFNTSPQFVLNSIEGTYVNTHLVTAQSALSAGTNYLIVQPIDVFSAGSLTIRPLMYLYPYTRVGNVNSPTQSFKRGTTQKFGIVYADDYGRLSTVLDHPAFTAANPWWREDIQSAASSQAGSDVEDIGQRYAKITINHYAPSWATKYYIVKSSSNGLNNYISFPLSKSDALPKMSNGESNPLEGKYFFRGYLRDIITDAASGLAASANSFGDQEYIYLPLNSLQGSQFGYTNTTSTPLAYDYTAGDRVRLCYWKNPTARTSYYQADADAEIITYNSELNCIAIRVNDLPDNLVGSSKIFDKGNEDGDATASGSTAVRGLLCEIYSPQQQRTAEFYYEMYQGDVTYNSADSKYYHSGNDQSQNSAQAAIIELSNGDCFLKPRTYAWKYTDSGVSVSGSSDTATYYVEEANYYDKQSSKTWGAGRPNRVIKSTSTTEDITGFIGQVERPNTIRYSEPFLPDQGYNGLGTIYDLNFKDTNAALKSVQKLHTDGSKTFVFHENAVGFAESDRAVVTTLDGNNMTIGANTPLSDVMYYSGRYGIGLNPESFAYNNNRKYFVDVDQAQVCRLSMDGVTPISEQGMNKYFKSKFREIINSPLESKVFGAYDKRTDEYILNIRNKVEIDVENTVDATMTNYYTRINVKLAYDFTDISQYDMYVGSYVNISYPSASLLLQTDSAGTTEARKINATTFSAYVSEISGSTAKMIIPTANVDDMWCFFNPELPLSGITPPVKIFVDKSTTLSYSERLKAWTSFHSWKPENMCSSGVDFVSFRAGKLYIHDDYNNPHSYYGTDYPAYIDIISNDNGDIVKTWKTFGVKAVSDDTIVDETDFLVAVASADTTGSPEPINGGVTDSRGSISTCTTPVYKEGQIYFDYMRTGTGSDYSGFVEGEKVRGYWTRTRLKIVAGVDKIYKIISSNFEYIISNYTR